MTVFTRVKAGEDFATLAATYSNDTGSAVMVVAWAGVSPGMMVPEFERVMKDTPVGQVSKTISNPVWLAYPTGYRYPPKGHDQEVQNVWLARFWGERQFDTEVDSWTRELRANAYVEIKRCQPRQQDSTKKPSFVKMPVLLAFLYS